MSRFLRPIGPKADLSELEYVSALHQSQPVLRTDGTVSSDDVAVFLRSRYGLVVDEDVARNVVRGLNGEGTDRENTRRSVDGVAKGRYENDGVDNDADNNAENDADLQKVRDKIADRDREREMKGLLEGRRKNNTWNTWSAKQRNGGAYSSNEKNDQEGEEDRRCPSDNEGQEEIEEADVAYLDIVQMLSVILMPTLAKMGGDHWTSHTCSKAPCSDTNGAASESEADLTRKVRRPQIKDMFRDVLGILLSSSGLMVDATDGGGGTDFPALDESLVRRLLETYYEYERSVDQDLVREMVAVAAGVDKHAATNGGSGNGNSHEAVLFDVDAFVRALTADLDKWDVGSETRDTTTFHDVFGFDNYKSMEERRERDIEEATDADADDNADAAAEAGKIVRPAVTPDSTCDGAAARSVPTKTIGRFAKSIDLPTDGSHDRLVREPTASFIDLGVDTHRSLLFVVFLFLFYITTSLVYMSLFQALPVAEGIGCGLNDYGCAIGVKILRWLMIALGLTLSGYLIMLPISLANNPTIRSNKLTVFCWVLAATYTTIPFSLIYTWKQNGEVAPPYDSKAEALADEADFELSMLIVLVSGCVLCLLLLGQFWLNTLTSKRVMRGGSLHRWMLPHNVRASANTKKAATQKVDSMLICARALHPGPYAANRADMGDRRGHVEETLTNYFKYGSAEVREGGTLWTWKRIWSKELFYSEGIWIHSRIIVGQVAQVVVAVFLAVAYFLVTPILAEEADEAREQLLNDFGDTLPEWIYDFVPTGHQVKSALYPASCLALIVCLRLISIYVPSTVQTIISFRTGIYGSLYDNDFQKYRIAADLTSTNVGNMLYAMFGSVTVFFVIWALFIFLHIWPITAEIMATLYAWIIGLLITIILKVIIVKTCRARFHRAFYRTRPVGANYAGLALECWHIGLGGGVLIGRIVQFLLASAFFIGRTDVPYLSPFVAVGGYRFDMVPVSFWKDILIHDAHRHPFIERLSAMYLMRLAYGNKFSSRAGACWRQLFVVALFPWMAKHRVFHHKRRVKKPSSPGDGDLLETDKGSNSGTNVDIFLRNLAHEVQDVGSLMVQEVATKDKV